MALFNILIYLCVFFANVLHSQTSVLLSYQTDYPDGDGYFILDNMNLTLTCSFDVTAFGVTWGVNGTTIYRDSTGRTDTDYKSRILDYSSTNTEHRLTLLIDRNNDLGRTVSCSVRIDASRSEEVEQLLDEILLFPMTATLQDTDVIISGRKSNITCVVNSINKGAEVTKFNYKIGDSLWLSNGTTSEIKMSDTFTVTNKQMVTLTYSHHQGKHVICEVVWMDGTSVETRVNSSLKNLDIYLPASSVDFKVSNASAISGNSVTVTCTTFSNPAPRLRLYRQREGDTTGVKVHEVTDVTLTHTLAVEAADNKAEFYCRVDDNREIAGWNFSEDSGRQKLTVLYKPSITYLANTSPDPTEGDRREMTCNSTSANPGPVLTLYRGDVEVKSVTGTQLKYTVDIRREINSVMFKCVATSSSPSAYTYSVEEGGRFYNVLFAPTEVTLDAPGEPVDVDAVVHLNCSANEANPVAEITWTTDLTTPQNFDVTTETRSGLHNALRISSILSIKAVKNINGAMLRCNVQIASLGKEHKIDVTFPSTKVTFSISKAGFLSESQTIMLTCETDEANPTADIVWMRGDGKSISAPTEVSEIDGLYNSKKSKSVLTIITDRSLNGVKYTCHVEQQAHLNGSKALSIKYAPLSNVLNSGPDSVLENSTKTVSCITGIGNPEGGMVWRYNDTLVTSGNSSHFLAGNYGGKEVHSSYTFTAQKFDNNAMISCTPKWNGNELDKLTQQTIINVKFTPEVSVKSPSNTLVEGSELWLTCEIEPGNPAKIETMHWKFVPKYKETMSQALPDQMKKKNITIQSTRYTDAGIYKCTAENVIGSNTGEIRVTVQYAPQLLTSDSLVFFAAFESEIVLSITVRAFPEITNLKSTFTWKTPNETIESTLVETKKLSTEIYQSNYMITNVGADDYTQYQVLVANSIKEVSFPLELKQQGPPEPPREVSAVAVAAEKVTISWIVGLNGGFPQTFTLMFNESGSEIPTDFIDPPLYERLEYTWAGLIPKTDYQVKVMSTTNFNNISTRSSDYITFRTRGKPEIDDMTLSVEISGSTAFISWEYDIPETLQNVTTLTIDQCNATKSCFPNNISELTARSLTVNYTDGDTFFLVIYQDGLEAYRSEQIQEKVPPGPGTSPDSPDRGSTVMIIGTVIGVLAVVLLALIIVIVIVRIKRRRQKLVEEVDNYLNAGKEHYQSGCTELSDVILQEKKQKSGSKMTAQKGLSKTKKKKEPLEDSLAPPADVIYENTEIGPVSETLVQKGDLLTHFSHMANSNLFEEEFGKLPSDPVHPWKYAAEPALKDKNRFKNMLPYDNNRIKLQDVDGEPLSDYINASYIKGHSGRNSYIATIGCTPESLNDFWRMLWEQKVSVVVMVTNLIEKNKRKCVQYWPIGNPQGYGQIMVTPGKVMTYADYIVKEFLLEKDGESRPLVHYHYVSWPDHGVPLTAAPILTIREHVRQHRAEGAEPIVVHCSAGIGRTGTFLAIDYLMDQVEVEGTVDVFECVREFRNQRVSMIQTKDQYRFVYEVLTEAICVGQNTVLTAADLNTIMERPGTDESLKSQFQLLQMTKPTYNVKETQMATMFGNENKNVDKDIVPAGKYRVVIKDSDDEYINAVYVEGYKCEKGFTATQIPLPSTISSFWKMIIAGQCKTIVCMESTDVDMKWYPTEKGTEQYGVYAVTNTGSIDVDGIVVTGLTVQLQGDGTYANVTAQGSLLEEEHRLMVFDVSIWSKKSLKDRNVATLRQLYSEVQQWQQQSKSRMVTAMCHNGADESGLYIASTYLFDMMNSEQEVDIFHSLKLLRRPRPQFITSLDQYMMLHEAVHEYTSQFGTYANFK